MGCLDALSADAQEREAASHPRRSHAARPLLAQRILSPLGSKLSAKRPGICMLPDTPLLLAFAGASLLLAITPGPAVVYIVARTVAQGRASGLSSVMGVALGNLANALAAALGLAALFAVSSAAFAAVKWAGAAYLVYLGIRMWRATPAATSVASPVPAQSLRRVFRDGFLVALLNPKTTLFFAAFLPQFMDAHGSPLMQTLALAGVFIAIAGCTDVVYVLAASLIAPHMARAARHGRWANRLAGTSFIGLGLLTALGSRPSR